MVHANGFLIVDSFILFGVIGKINSGHEYGYFREKFGFCQQEFGGGTGSGSSGGGRRLAVLRRAASHFRRMRADF
jgi:hypothetical protein